MVACELLLDWLKESLSLEWSYTYKIAGDNIKPNLESSFLPYKKQSTDFDACCFKRGNS